MAENKWTVDNYVLVGVLEEAVFGRRMRWVSYIPTEPPGVVLAYRRVKNLIKASPVLSALVGAGGVGAVSAALPRLADTVLGHLDVVSMVVAGSFTGVKVLDRYLDPSPESQVRRTFRGIEDLWSQSYQAKCVENPSRKTVDRFVRLARNPNYIVDDIDRAEDPENEAKRLGVVASLAADLLAAWGSKNSLRKVDPAGVLRTVLAEKAWQPEDESALESIRRSRRFVEVLRILKGKDDAGDDPAIDRLEDLLKSPDLQLRIYVPSGHALPHFGTQMSRGSVRVTGVPGNSAFSYLGLHAPTAKPYVFLQDGAGPFCASNQMAGLVIVNGPAGREASKDQRGGLALYLGEVAQGAFVRMNGSAVGVLYRPIDPDSVGPVKNGRLVFLEQGPSPRAPSGRRYVDGKLVQSVTIGDMPALVQWVKDGLSG